MSLRTRILLLVLVATLAPTALLGVYLFENRKDEIFKAQQSLSALATYSAENLSNKVSGTVQLLHGLSRASDLDTDDKAACSTFLATVLKRYPQYTGLLTIRPDGQLHCDSLATGRTLDLNDRGYFKQARASTDPAFEVVVGRLTGIGVLQVAFPARNSRGELRYVLLASLNLAQFSELIATASRHPRMEVVIWDRKGTLIVRHPDDGRKKLSGSSLTDSPLYRFVRSKHTGDVAELVGPDGTPKIWALGVLPDVFGSDLRITLGIPRNVLLAAADHDLRQALAILASVSLLAFLAALLLAEVSIRRPVARISAAAAHQRSGDFSARIGTPYPRGELGGLMVTLDTTAAAVETQQVEIERKSNELRRTNRTLRIMGAINSTIVRVHNRDDLLAEVCRIAAEEGQFPIVWAGLLDRETMQVKPISWRGVDEAYLLSIPRAATDTEGLVGPAIRHKRTIIANDTVNEVRMVKRNAAAKLGSKAIAVLPLIVADEVAGVFVLHAREVGFFDEQEVKLLNELAGDIAFALDYIEKSEKLDYLAYYDPLTGLANRALFLERLNQFLSGGGRNGRMLALVVGDIERFRTINDTFGRAAGDDLLKQIAVRAGRQITDERWLAHIGADHFACMIPDEVELSGVVRRIERWDQEVFGRPYRLGETELRVAARFGIALFPADAADADTLFRYAEAALKKAQASGERYLFYVPDMTERVAERLTLENKLRTALERDEFVLHYQPKVDLATMRIVGVEALIRWQSPELGLVPPMEFISLLEETGLILHVGAWALRRAACDHREWQEAGLNAPRIAVNVSPIQLRQRDFVRRLEQGIKEGVAPTCIDVELTESLVMGDIEGNIRKLKEVRALGVSIAIDDFGTGYSSLAYLAKLPVQTLKIDRSFIITMLNDPDTMTMVSTIITLAHSLRLKVVAEGVDAQEQAKMLRLLHCDEMQGYFFSRPIPKNELAHLLLQQEKPEWSRDAAPA